MKPTGKEPASTLASETKPKATNPKSTTATKRRVPKSVAPRPGSKKAKILALLKRPTGVSLAQLEKATGWQPHSVRGFLSAAIKKQMGLRLQVSPLPDGSRAYRVLNP